MTTRRKKKGSSVSLQAVGGGKLSTTHGVLPGGASSLGKMIIPLPFNASQLLPA